jgi:hypothetical protein
MWFTRVRRRILAARADRRRAVLARSFEVLEARRLLASSQIAATPPSFNTSNAGVTYGYTISGANVPQPTTVNLDWASGTTVNTVIGNPIVSTATMTTEGPYVLNASAAQLGTPPPGANDLLVVADPSNIISPADPSKVAALALSRITAVQPTFDNSGGVDYGYTIGIANLPQATTVDLDWASGTTAATVIGSPITSMPTATSVGTYSLTAPPSQLASPPPGARDLLVVADPGNLISSAGPTKVAALALPDLAVTTPAFATNGGLSFGYTISGANLPQATSIALFWAPAQTFDPAADTMAFSTATQTAVGSYGPIVVSAAQLAAQAPPPMGTTYLLVVANPPESENPGGLIVESNKINNVAALTLPVLAVQSIQWHPSTADQWNAPTSDLPKSGANAGGVDIAYTISGANLPQTTPIALYWVDASGNKLSAPITTGDDGAPLVTATAVDAPGHPYSIHVPASQLLVPPPGATGLVVALDPSGSSQFVGPVAMVNQPNASNTFTTNAASILAPYMLNGTEVNPVGAQVNAHDSAEMDATFRPAGGALTLDQARVLLGVTAFNWVQTVSFPRDWTALEFDLPNTNITISQTLDPATGLPLLDQNGNAHLQAIPDIYYNYQANQYESFSDTNKNGKLDSGPPAQPGLPDELPSLAPIGPEPLPASGVLDPLVSGSSGSVPFVVLQTTSQQSGTVQFTRVALPSLGTDPAVWQAPDSAIYYFNAGAELDSAISQHDDTLDFVDVPSFQLLHGSESVSFTTELAGVGSAGAQTWIGDNTNFNWTSNALRMTGSASDPENEIDYWQISNAAYAPAVTSGGVSGVQFSDPAQTAPVLASIGNVNTSPGSTVRLSAAATGSSAGEVVNYALDPGAPVGAAIDSGTGSFSWTVPATEPPGQYPVTVRGTDSANPSLSGTASFMIVVQQPPSLSAVAVTGTYGGTATLKATLTAGGSPLAGKTIAFTLNENGTMTTAGTATTDGNGVATLSGVSLAGFNPGSFTGAVGASFAGDSADLAASASGDLTVSPAQAAVSLSGLLFTYNGTAQTATVTTIPAGLSGASVSYTLNGAPVAAPMQAGRYSVQATLTNPNYTAASVTGTLVINQATTTLAWAPPADITSGSALGDAQLDATASVPGTFTYTPAAGTVLPSGQGQVLSVTFTPADTTDYAPAAGSTTINVLDPPQVVAIASVPSKKGLSAFTVRYSEPLSASSAGDSSLYHVFVAVTKIVKKHKMTVFSKALAIRGVTPSSSADTVTINLAKPFKGMVEVTVQGTITAANGSSSSVDFPMIVK